MKWDGMGLNDMLIPLFFYSTSSAPGEKNSMNSPVLTEWAPDTALSIGHDLISILSPESKTMV